MINCDLWAKAFNLLFFIAVFTSFYQWRDIVGNKCINQSVVIVDAGLVDLINSPSGQNSGPGDRKSVKIHLTEL
jgi:hypothetical protein